MPHLILLQTKPKGWGGDRRVPGEVWSYDYRPADMRRVGDTIDAFCQREGCTILRKCSSYGELHANMVAFHNYAIRQPDRDEAELAREFFAPSGASDGS